MRIINAILIVMLLSMQAMGEERPERRRRRTRSSEPRAVDRTLEQARRDLKKAEEARSKAMENASLEMIKGLFKKAREADRAERWGAAYYHYHDVSSSRAAGARDMVAQSRSRMHELDGIAEERVRQARKKEYHRQYSEAVAMYRAVVKDFGFSRHADEARRRISSLSRSNVSAPAMILAEAQALEKAKNHLGAKCLYKHLSVRHPGSVEAIIARKKLDHYNKDIFITESIEAALEREARKKAPGMLLMAENFLKNKMSERARYYLDMIIEKYPKTEWADKARAKLETLE